MSSFKSRFVWCASLALIALTGCGSVLDDVEAPKQQVAAPAPTPALPDADAGSPVADSGIIAESGPTDVGTDLAKPDGGASEASLAETGVEVGETGVDSVASDAGATDTGSVDSGFADSGSADAGPTVPGPFPGVGNPSFPFTKCEDVPPGNLVVIMKSPTPRWPGLDGSIGFRYLARSSSGGSYTEWVKPTCLASSSSVDMASCCFGFMPKGAMVEFINGVVSAPTDAEFREWFTTVFGGFFVRGVSYDVCWSPSTTPSTKIGGYTPTGGFTGALSRASGVTANLLVTMPL